MPFAVGFALLPWAYMFAQDLMLKSQGKYQDLYIVKPSEQALEATTTQKQRKPTTTRRENTYQLKPELKNVEFRTYEELVESLGKDYFIGSK